MTRKMQKSEFGASIFVSLVLVMGALPATSVAGDLALRDSMIKVAPGQEIAGSIHLGIESHEVSIAFQGDTTNWDLDPMKSPILKQATLFAKGDSAWQIYVSSDTGGCMSEYDNINGFIPNGRRLHTPLNISADGGSTIDLSRGGVLIKGSGEMIIPITLEQHVAWNDEPLPQGHDYRVLINFVASNGGSVPKIL